MLRLHLKDLIIAHSSLEATQRFQVDPDSLARERSTEQVICAHPSLAVETDLMGVWLSREGSDRGIVFRTSLATIVIMIC